MTDMNRSIAGTRLLNNTTANRQWTKVEQAYFSAFVVATLLCFSPSKLLAYFAPIAVISLFTLIARKRSILQRVLCIIALGALFIIFHALFERRFAFISAIIQLLTYGAFIVVVAIDHRYLRNPMLQTRIENFIRWVALVQSVVGITQAIYAFIETGTFDSNSGDAVAGTISASLLPDGTMSNYMFGVNLTFIILFLLPPALLKRKGRLILLLIAVTFVFASVLHVMIFLGISLFIAIVLCRPTLPRGWTRVLILVVIAGLVAAAATLLSTNWSLLPRLIQGVTSGEYPRAQVYERVMGKMVSQYPLLPILGLGPGQFSSRAAAMASGYYLGGVDNPRKLPLLPTAMSPAFSKYLLDLWFRSKNNAGSTSQPFSSWLAVYTEFGGLATAVLLFVLGYHLLKVVLLANQTKQRWYGTVLCTAMLFLFLLGLQDVYWEVPQAILIGVMCIKVMHGQMSVSLKRNYVWN